MQEDSVIKYEMVAQSVARILRNRSDTTVTDQEIDRLAAVVAPEVEKASKGARSIIVVRVRDHLREMQVITRTLPDGTHALLDRLERADEPIDPDPEIDLSDPATVRAMVASVSKSAIRSGRNIGIKNSPRRPPGSID